MKAGVKRWPGLAIVLGIIVTSIGLFLLNCLAVAPLQRVRAARDWMAVPCTIVSSQMKERPHDDGVIGFAEIVYRYDVGKQQYVSHQLSFFDLFPEDAVNVDANRPGAQTTCFVDPSDPSEAVLQRGVTATGRRQMFVPIPVLAIGLYFLVGGCWKFAVRSTGRDST